MIRVLIIDDDFLEQSKISTALRRWGCQVVEAQNTIEAVAKPNKEPADLIILGSTLLDAESSTLFRQLGVEWNLRKVPVIVVGSNNDRRRISAKYSLNIVGCLTKPTLLSELRKQIQIAVPYTAIKRKTL